MHVFVHAHAQQTMGNGHDFIPLKNMLLASFALRYNVCSKHQMPKIQTSSLFHWSAEICAFGVHAHRTRTDIALVSDIRLFFPIHYISFGEHSNLLLQRVARISFRNSD